MRGLAYMLFIFMGFLGFSQNSNYKSKKVAFNNTIQVDSVSINSNYFLLQDKNNKTIDTSFYVVDFTKAKLSFIKPIETDSIIINYLKFPEFLTKTYKQLDDRIITEDNANNLMLYKLSQPNTQKTFVPFDGLTSSGSISRGVFIGNNQNSVLNSELDLQISGKLSETISLRASIQDANIPLQESGYSQRLDEFDQVFIELFSDNWNIRAGDIDLENNYSYFAEFSKRVQGLLVNTNLGKQETKTNLFASGALVRGQFTTSSFTAQEGNQGPYKLQGPNGELFVLIVSGSETVYVNGIAVKRGENKDYIIDYNAGEIIFNSTFPITSEMRITVDYQYSERNYSRVVAYGGTQIKNDKLQLGISVYSESDSKNQPLQQNLSENEVEVLSNAGDNRSQMTANSAAEEAYDENKILYKKEIVSGIETFVFSTNPNDVLYRVSFTNVGQGNGDYNLSNTNSINNIYEFVGVNQGEYDPVVQLVAPVKIQVAVINGEYVPNEKTQVMFEGAASKNDLNLFSDLDDDDNDGFAGKLNINQYLVKKDSLWNLKIYADGDYISNTFRNIQGLYNPEFNRDWNLDLNNLNGIGNNLGDQMLLNSGFQVIHPKKGSLNYQYEYLNYESGFNGNRHIFNSNLILNKLRINSNSSYLNSNSNLNTSSFLRSYNNIVYGMKKSWIGTNFEIEDNQQKEKLTNSLTAISQRFKTYKVFLGVGDSTKIFTEIGYRKRVNDSIQNNLLQEVNSSNNYYFDAKLIQNNNSSLSIYANYRTLKYTNDIVEDEHSLNSRILYNQKLFNQIIQWNTAFETNSGTLPQQEFTYVEVEPGQGSYTWIDYNNNSIQELGEFEIAQFQDQGKYIRVLLPNQIYLKTHQNRLSQNLTLNPTQWSNSESVTKRFFSHFYNQTTYLIDRKIERNNSNFNLNPFDTHSTTPLGLQLNFRNVLFFNRGKQHYTSSYTFFSNKTKNVLTVEFDDSSGTRELSNIDFIESNINSHQYNFNHKISNNWLFNFFSALDFKESTDDNSTNRNFKFEELRLNPKISYLFGTSSSFDILYQLATKENTIGAQEYLEQQKYGLSFMFSKQEQGAINGEINYYSNSFNGNANTPVAYQMLEGLQAGKNFTWTLLIQKKLTEFLDLNLSYFGRKTETSKTIHTGSVQLKAYF